MLDLSTRRQGPLDALGAVARSGAGVELSIAAPCARFALRCAPGAIPATAQAFGAALSATVGRAVVAGDHAALCLGPDEWLLIAPPADAPAIAHQLETALANASHALVDVGHRSAAIVVNGAQAATLLN